MTVVTPHIETHGGSEPEPLVSGDIICKADSSTGNNLASGSSTGSLSSSTDMLSTCNDNMDRNEMPSSTGATCSASALRLSVVPVPAPEGTHRRHNVISSEKGTGTSNPVSFRGKLSDRGDLGGDQGIDATSAEREQSRKRPRRQSSDQCDSKIDGLHFRTEAKEEAEAKTGSCLDGRGDDDTLASTSLSLSTVERDLGEGRTSPPSPIDATKRTSMCGAERRSAAVASQQRRPLYCRRPRHRMGGFGGVADSSNSAKCRASPPPSGSSKAQTHSEHMHDPLILFGLDLSSQPPSVQFFLCACGVFAFTIVYGYLQELLAVHIAGRKFGLFLATCQFAGYAFWSFVLTRIRAYRQGGTAASADDGGAGTNSSTRIHAPGGGGCNVGPSSVPLRIYIGLSLIRALDLGMTNLAMQFLNYPAKTLIKSSRVVFTMLLGLVIGGKRYRYRDYLAVSLLVAGLGIFLHADARSKTVFHPLGVAMLVVSLTCDGTLNNWSEVIMRGYKVGQDEFQLQLYTIAFLAMIFATHAKGELVQGVHHFFLEAGTVPDIESGDSIGDDVTWTVRRKVLVLFFFSTTGLLGSSCAGAITKRFGALSMSITSTARKAMTLFLSFVAFHNTCTFEHIAGMVIFLGALLMKSLCAKDNFDSDAARQAMIHGSPSTMELNKLSTEDEISVNSIDDGDGADQELRPLMETAGEEVDLEAASMTKSDDFHDNPSDYSNVNASANVPPADASLFGTARPSSKLASLLSHVGPGIRHDVSGNCDGASHSS
mmetsp:Transcript_18815/g.40986  ORF Transcript_18815/g.40986 Transcript_18815/m.40986 type:complete len:770 (+) Transcript_18815:449-2758(+)